MGITSGILERCISECNKSTYKYKVGAVIFNKKRIISSGHNAIRANSIHPKYRIYANALHAEQAALIGLDWGKLKGCSILVMKLSKTKGLLSNAKPCSICLALLEHVGIESIYYSDHYGQIVRY